MDRLDVRILRFLLQGEAFFPLNPDFRSSYAAIAERVGADEDTVRHRVKKLHETGFLGDWRLQVNPRMWGGGQVVVFVDVDPQSPKDDLLEDLRLLPGATSINVFQSRLGITLTYEHEASVTWQAELVRRLAGASTVLVARIPFPDCETDLSARDWDLIRALRSNPRKSCSALAGEIGLSSHTVRRKLVRIVGKGVAFAWPSLDPQGIGSGVLACLSVVSPRGCTGEVDEAITTHLESSLWQIEHMLPYGGSDLQPTSYNLVLPNISGARDIQNWATEVPGVQSARVDLQEDILTNFATYDEYLDGKLREMPTAMPAVTVSTNRKAAPALKHRPRRTRRSAIESSVRWSGT